MSSRRHALLALCSLVTLSGCGSQSEGASATTPVPSSTARRSADEGGTPSGRGESITVVNDSEESRYVTLAVEREGETLFVESQTVHGGTSVRFDGVVPATGTSRIVVDTAAGVSGQFDWQPTASVDTLRVELGDEITFSAVVRCEPDCEGVSLGGTSTGYPEDGFDPRGRRVASTLRLRSTATTPQVVRVRVADGDVLDYRYRMPTSTTLRVPVPQRSGETAVVVSRLDDAGGVRGRRRHQWAMERSPTLDIGVGTTIGFSCGARSRDLRLQNDDDVAHTLSVEVRTPDGKVRFTERFEVGPGESVDVADVVETAGDYRLTAETASSSSTTDWSTCPSSGPLSVRIRADGRVVVGGSG